MAGEHEQSSHCEQSLSLAEETTDESLVSLINQLLAAPGVSDFGEFLDLSCVQEVIPYSVLMKDLDLVSVRQLEDLLIEAMYAGVIQGKLDQCRQQLEVDFCISRDIPYEGIVKISSILTQWCSNCETVLTSIPQQVGRMNECKDAHLKAHQEIEAEVRIGREMDSNTKKALLSEYISLASLPSGKEHPPADSVQFLHISSQPAFTA
uniref:Uncharacterized protein n=1 Tax=Myripristis murdjan TaxID=586833 RepID=A0A667WSZ4_9TELE